MAAILRLAATLAGLSLRRAGARAAGVTATFAAALLFLLVITGQAHRTQALVDLRTAELAQLAHYDSLTGLLNRSHWMTCAQAALQGAHRHGHAMAVIFLDLDHFKRINDTLGHTFGDELLQEVSQRLLPCLRREDLLARIGGDGRARDARGAAARRRAHTRGGEPPARRDI